MRRRITPLLFGTTSLVTLLCVGTSRAADKTWTADKLSIFVPGLAKRVQLHIVSPPDIHLPNRVPVILALPPGPGDAKTVMGALGKYWAKEALKRKMVVICPEMRGQSFARAAFRLVPHVLGTVAQRYPADTRKVVIAGNSNGGVGAFGCFVQCPTRFSGLLVFPGAPLSGVDVPRTLAGKTAYVLVGEKDGVWIRGSEEMNAYLRRAGVHVRYEVVPGQGHSLRIPPERLFDWIESAVSQ